jgi:hypothetical protein
MSFELILREENMHPIESTVKVVEIKLNSFLSGFALFEMFLKN